MHLCWLCFKSVLHVVLCVRYGVCCHVPWRRRGEAVKKKPSIKTRGRRVGVERGGGERGGGGVGGGAEQTLVWEELLGN